MRVLKVKAVKHIPKGYLGMNPLAAKELGIPCPKDTILIKKSLSPKQKKLTVAHEKIEFVQMQRGSNYRKAHKVASSLEKNVKL